MHIYLQLRKNIETVLYYVLHEQHGIICTFPAGWLLWALHNKFQKKNVCITSIQMAYMYIHYNYIAIGTITLQSLRTVKEAPISFMKTLLKYENIEQSVLTRHF